MGEEMVDRVQFWQWFNGTEDAPKTKTNRLIEDGHGKKLDLGKFKNTKVKQ